MNRLLKFFVNGPIWTGLLKFLFLPKFKQLFPSEALSAAKVLELGCGAGESTKIFKTWFPDALITATDYDASQVEAAGRRCAGISGIGFERADAGKLPYKDDAFDLAIETNTFHHVQDWPSAIGEAARVLKKGGIFAIMDEGRQITSFPLFRIIDRPDAVFGVEDFCTELKNAGLKIETAKGKGIFYIIAKKI